jgi:hypothetical protein
MCFNFMFDQIFGSRKTVFVKNSRCITINKLGLHFNDRFGLFNGWRFELRQKKRRFFFILIN